ncbi:unnamed protein product [Ixodes hexagonus]
MLKQKGLTHGPAALSKKANSFCFTSRFSTMASTTRSTFFTASSGLEYEVALVTRLRDEQEMPTLLLSANCFFATRLRLSSMRPLDFSKTSFETSTRTTWWPERHATCAIPAPIEPPPITATCLIAAFAAEEAEKARKTK